MKNILIFLSIVLTFSPSWTKDTYKGAVVEHHAIKDTYSYDDLLETVKVYIKHIENAAKEKVDIIVFPEDGLSASVNSEDTLWASSTKLPDPGQRIAPCDEPAGLYSNYLIEFSCASKLHQIYSVVNLIEAVDNNSSRPTLYNVNVVFDRKGVIIARHRKINLYEEYYYKPGPNTTTTTFTTDFNVTFGMFVCFDIFFESPADDLLKNKNVTDIVFSTSWYQELPFFIGNSVQHAYAVMNGVNFLASGLSDLETKMGGSGIYSANGEVLSAFISGKNESKLVIATVPKIKSKQDLSNGCHKGATTSKSSFSPYIHLRKTVPPRLTNHSFFSINLNESHIHKTICANKRFCCTFNGDIRKTLPELPNYAYKLIIYDGATQMDEKTMGFAQCAIVACTNESVSSCGNRLESPPTGIYFENLSIKGTFNNTRTRYMPLTVGYNLLPIKNYVYCRKNNESKIEVSLMTTQRIGKLLTFGILGRHFKNDNKPPGLY